MDKIKCQAEHVKDDGCSVCGGFGHVLLKSHCPSCGHEYWDIERIGSTVYDGKEIHCFDGTVITWRSGVSTTCSNCPEEEK